MMTTGWYSGETDAELFHWYRPRLTGYRSWSDSITIGRKKLFQMAVSWKRKTVTRPGPSIRSDTRTYVVSSPAPSTRAASSTSSGT